MGVVKQGRVSPRRRSSRNLHFSPSSLLFLDCAVEADIDIRSDGVRSRHIQLRSVLFGTQWVLSIPADRNPLMDMTGEFCGEGQSGAVWFPWEACPQAAATGLSAL